MRSGLRTLVWEWKFVTELSFMSTCDQLLLCVVLLGNVPTSEEPFTAISKGRSLIMGELHMFHPFSAPWGWLDDGRSLSLEVTGQTSVGTCVTDIVEWGEWSPGNISCQHVDLSLNNIQVSAAHSGCGDVWWDIGDRARTVGGNRARLL